jgi:hypothetical protein
MLKQILILISVVVISFCLGYGIIISYHLKRFGPPADPNIKKILNVFRFGIAALIFLNLLFLSFNVLKK